jgi:hypothetical protein
MAVVIRNQRPRNHWSVAEVVAAQVVADFQARRYIKNVQSARELRKALIERGILKPVS